MEAVLHSGAIAEDRSVALTRSPRIMSVDALRGLIMFVMIFVNDLAGAPDEIVPAWMKHFGKGDGMTFVDLVFPAFLFIVGMSIPFALGSRLTKGEPVWRVLLHVVTRTLALLFLGILMVNESPSSKAMGWSATLWVALMYLSAMLAFCDIVPSWVHNKAELKTHFWRYFTWILRIIGFASLVWLAFAFRGRRGQHIITLSPFSIHHDWYGILGLIGWAYLIASLVFLIFRENRTALLGATVLLMCLYPADKNGFFDNFFLGNYVGIGDTLGSQAAITLAGVLLASILVAPRTATDGRRAQFTFLFIIGFSIAAMLLRGLYGINKDDATPSWCLWACAITAALWLIFYFISDVWRIGFITKPLAIAGQNVLLAYLISEGLDAFLGLLHLDDWYSNLAEADLFHACARSAGCAAAILVFTALVNRAGFRLKL
ncbi:MAG TPA: DUF5009 domain-containing protein [Candidatus Methylacidiphilales bacterium]|nr:DUF5009 domain-containing protein [Candidatus Methylacidiphilales bacterium]